MRSFLRKTPSFYKYLFWIWLILMLSVSSYPKLPNPKIELGGTILRVDYIFHWLEYSVLLSLFVFWRTRIRQDFTWQIGWIALILGVSLATFDELHQLFIPGRSFNPIDMLYNYLGVITGLFFSILLVKKIIQKPAEVSSSEP